MISPVKRVIRWFMITICCLCVCILFCNYKGVCLREWKILSDQELMREMILSCNDEGSGMYFNNDGPEEYKEVIPYDSIEEFMEKNPECCSIIYRNGSYTDESYDLIVPSFFNRITGQFNFIARVKYTRRYISYPVINGKKQNGELKKIEMDVTSPIGNCGGICMPCCDSG